MDDPRWLRIILFGLVLAALTIGYLIFSGKFAKPATVTNPQTSNRVDSSHIESVTFASASAIPSPLSSPKPKLALPNQVTPSAYTRILNRTQASVKVLPRTGLPDMLFGIIALSAIISGWFLRKYPK